jgi:hypothetical protein
LKRKLNFQRSLLSDPHLWIAFAAAIIFLLMEFLHELKWLPWEPSPEGLLMVITIVIIALVADRLMEGEEVKENSEKLGRIANSLFGKGASLRRRPSTQEEYDYLWGGYTGKYYVYNPSYRVDQNTGADEIVKIFVHRYQNSRFERARYIFLTKDDPGERDLATFHRLMASVKQKYPDVVKKIELKELKNREASSEGEIYLGMRDGMRMGVMELKEPSSDPQHGMPHYYLVIHDQEVLENHILRHFEAAWNDTNAEDVQSFWSDRFLDSRIKRPDRAEML